MLLLPPFSCPSPALLTPMLTPTPAFYVPPAPSSWHCLSGLSWWLCGGGADDAAAGHSGNYCLFKEYSSTAASTATRGDEASAAIEAFNQGGSEKFIFLLSTRAGLGIRPCHR